MNDLKIYRLESEDKSTRSIPTLNRIKERRLCPIAGLVFA